ncbi:Uncharacterised protein [Candidatus Anstonella stagnisolia]|nr:Uncharacterised protein [Candidatus Anstonella stagnisolia]
MANVDVMKAISESFNLLKKHYQEVAFPIILLILLTGVGNFGGSTIGKNFSPMLSGTSSTQAASNFPDYSVPVNALTGTPTGANFPAAIGGIILIAILALMLISLVAMVFNRATLLYVYGHFYALLNKKKQKEGWQGRFKRFTIKAIVLEAFWILLCIILFALPAFMLWNAISQAAATGNAPSGMLGSMVLALAVAALSVLMLLIVCFLLAPMWIFYAMDGCGFFDSMGKSFTLVSGNLVTFLVLGIVFFALTIAGVAVSIATCCFSYVVSPLISVSLMLLYGITLMKIKMALAKK